MAHDTIYRKDNADVAFSCRSVEIPRLNQTVGPLRVGSVAVDTGTTPTWPDGAVAFFGSKNSQALALPDATVRQGQMIYVTTAGTGTITLTGYSAQTWNGVGTGTITPGKYTLLISDGANWRSVITSL